MSDAAESARLREAMESAWEALCLIVEDNGHSGDTDEATDGAGCADGVDDCQRCFAEQARDAAHAALEVK